MGEFSKPELRHDVIDRQNIMTDSAREARWIVGVDVGGTKVAAGLVNEQGELSQPIRAPMNPRGTAAEGFAAVTSVLDKVFNDKRKDNSDTPIGVCAPGPLDPRTGVVLNPPNVPCWRNFPLVAELQRRYGVTARLDNDANAAALAESLWGAGRGYSNVFYACIGTGIGTGVVFDGRIFHGRTGSAAEGGHVSIDYRGPTCNCGKKGCIEALASGTAIARRAREAVSGDPTAGARLLGLANGDGSSIRSEMIGTAAQMNDPLAQQILADTIEFLAIWLGNIVDLLEPDVMILGGGVSEMLRPGFPQIQDRLKTWCVNARCCEIPLVPAHYGENSGVAGGAALCFVPAEN
ncbi:MAG TPA: ROK family protein [Bryobacteraceae bacterium]|nr:ROK family protein [Bryobacteraceae bacterium]